MIGNGTLFTAGMDSEMSLSGTMLEYRNSMLPEEGGWPKPLFYPVCIVFITGISMFVAQLAYIFAVTFYSPHSTNNDKMRKKFNSASRFAVLYYLANHMITGISASISLAINWYRGNLWWDLNEIPNMTWPEFGVHIGVVMCYFWLMIVVYDGLTYAFHLLEHKWRWLYRVMHSQHHENKFPCSSVESIYGDIFEGGLVSWFFFIQCILYTNLPVTALSMMGITISCTAQWNHSGVNMKVPWLFYDSEKHLWHHMDFNCNYSEHTPVWDILFGTSKSDSWSEEKTIS